MSSDEVFANIVFGLIALAGWGRWLAFLICVRNWSGDKTSRGLLLLAPILSAIGLLWVLRHLASHDVVNDWRYIAMYLLMGIAWLPIGNSLISVSGLSHRFDALERRNWAAALSISGWQLGVMACFAGANIGDGPRWWVVVICAAIATGSLFVCWAALDMFARLGESVTIERDLASGVRSGSFFLASGLILGRAVAGDWHSLQATLHDFALGAWPVLVLTVGAVSLELRCRPTTTRRNCPLLSAGVLPAMLFVSSALFWLAARGMPR